MKNINSLKVLTDYKQFQIFILGVFSGMPLFLIYSTLAAWLKSSNIDIAIITSLAISRVFYSLKFLWAPVIDHLNLPLLHKIGRRKSWMCLISLNIAAIIFCYSRLEPETSMREIYILTILLGFASASLDIVIDAYRIDNIEESQLSVAAANAIFGYRIGGLIAGAGAFFVAADYGWTHAFSIISSLYLIGIIFMLTLKEKKISKKEFNVTSIASWKSSTVTPFIDFFQRQYSVIILIAVIFYKLGDAMLGVVATPFYIEMGFGLKEIAAIGKLYGFIATILGSYTGGLIMLRYGNLKGMIFCAIAQSVTNFAYIWLLKHGHDTNALIITITIENIGAGMGDAALVGYLSYLCNKKFSATQYALLSSASGLYSHTIVGFGGTIQKIIGWEQYFTMTVILALPGLLTLIWLNFKLNKSENLNIL